MKVDLNIIKHNSIGYKETECIYYEDDRLVALVIMVNRDDSKGEFSQEGCFLAERIIKGVLVDFHKSYKEDYINKLWFRKKADEIKKKIIELWKESVIKDYIENKGQINNWDVKDILKKYGVTFQAILFTNELIVATKVGYGDIIKLDKDDRYESLFKDISYEDEQGYYSLANIGDYKGIKVKILKIDETFEMPKAFIAVSHRFIESFPNKSEYEANITKIMKSIESKCILYGDYYIKRKVSQISKSTGEDLSMAVILINNVEDILSNYRWVLNEDYKFLEDARLSEILGLMIKDNEFFEKNRKIVENKWCFEGSSISASVAAANIAYVLYKLGREDEAKEREKGISIRYMYMEEDDVYKKYW